MMASDLAETIAKWRLSIWDAETSAEVQMILDAAEAGIRARDAALEEAAKLIDESEPDAGSDCDMAVQEHCWFLAHAIRALKGAA